MTGNADKNSFTCVCIMYHFVNPSQKKGIIPDHQMLIESVKGVSSVDQLSSVQNFTNVPLVVPNPRVGARLHELWEKWAARGVSPKVLAILREGYTLPLRFQPNLTRNPTITSCYVNPHRNSYLLETLHQLLNQNAVELVQNPQSLGIYNRLFLVPKTNNRWRPILNLSLPLCRGVGDLHRLQRRILPHTNNKTIQEVHALSYSGQDLTVQSTTLWSLHGPHGVYSGGQRVQTTSNEKGYKNPPVPRRLVGQRQIPPNLSSTHKPW